MDALVSFGVAGSVCDAVGEVAIDQHDDEVQLHCLGRVLLQGGVSSPLALCAVHQLVQVQSQPGSSSPTASALLSVCPLCSVW